MEQELVTHKRSMQTRFPVAVLPSDRVQTTFVPSKLRRISLLLGSTLAAVTVGLSMVFDLCVFSFELEGW